jgi:hypothetical protein
MKLPAIDINALERDFAQLQRRGVVYGYGAKAPGLDCDLARIKAIDCSGYARLALYRATAGELIIPDGSQMQRSFFEVASRGGAVRQVNYADAARHITDSRLFIAFIKPFTHGCGPVGHVWLLSKYDDGNNGTLAGTLESHGGGGINSRAWNNRTLLREVYSCFELPTS